eukprot:TRINITY_DN11787_c0_g1_i1.p1 TRINITY_DN11787_c0_g1~~TRINITY_DN11787_c0_g1_i1.p1  ORF type:complete len:568 (-),score=115.27 TRINITY_DN11787_c0_g1_i1:127-1830(-)
MLRWPPASGSYRPPVQGFGHPCSHAGLVQMPSQVASGTAVRPASSWNRAQPQMMPQGVLSGSFRVPVHAPPQQLEPRPQTMQIRHTPSQEHRDVHPRPQASPSVCYPVDEHVVDEHGYGVSSGANDETEGNADAEFLRLLDSLEVRVDLMAQMQHTRNQIQARSGSEASEPTPQPEASPSPRREPQQLLTQLQALQQCLTEVEKPAAEEPRLGGAESDREQRLAQENEELWTQLDEQSNLIRKLTGEVALLQSNLKESLLESGEDDLKVQSLRRELEEERRLRSAEAQAWSAEKERMLAELRELRGRVEILSSPSSPSTSSPWRRLGGLDDSSALPPREALAAEAAALQGLARSNQDGEGAFTAPFSRTSCGANVTLSEDGYVAARTRGCRQSVLLGSAPLQRQELGWYYELQVRETVEGWVGGLGIGVTKSSPEAIPRVPDKAWRMPKTFMIGYWGCVFLDGQERRTNWRADTLPAGACVGILVAGDDSGDLRIFVDKSPVVYIEGALKGIMEPGLELYPVVDVFAATLAVQLQPYAKVPEPPWASGEEVSTSAAGTPAASLASGS